MIEIHIEMTAFNTDGNFASANDRKLLEWVYEPKWKPPILTILTCLILINLFSLKTLLTERFRSNTLYAYLSAMATVDILFLSTSLVFVAIITRYNLSNKSAY